MHRFLHVSSLALFIALFLVIPSRASAADLETGTLAAGTPHETPYFLQRADVPGPTVLIVGGIHGNEPAGAHAVEVVRYWPIERGTVISVPRANIAALAAKTRKTPDVPPEQSQLNRAFPRPDAEYPKTPENPLARDLWELVVTHKPDWVLDCHEGFGFHKSNANSIGSSIISDGKPETSAFIDNMLEAVNAGIEVTEKQFVKQPGPLVAGSLVRAASDHADSKTMILATSTKDQRIPIRARQHRQMLHAALSQLEMLPGKITPDSISTSLCDESLIQVGIYDDGGVGGSGRERIEKDLLPRPNFRTVRVDGHDIRAGNCDGFDVLIFSGGIGSAQAKSLRDEGCQRIKKFVEEGGIYIGICAGAYLASSGKGYCLGLLDVQTKSPLWMRGRAELQVELTPAGKKTFAVQGPSERTILYVNGPVWKHAKRDDLPDAKILAWYRTETAKNGTPEGIMVDSPALIEGQYGEGVAIAFSCHPEQTANCEDFVFRVIYAAKTREPVRAAQ